MSNQLGRFNHHPEPAIDFEIEVEELGTIVSDVELGVREAGELPIERCCKAMEFRVGGDQGAVKAKAELRGIEARLVALAFTAQPSEARRWYGGQAPAHD